MRLLPESRLVLDALEARGPQVAESLGVRAALIAELVPSCIAVALRVQPTGLTVALVGPLAAPGPHAAPPDPSDESAGPSDVLSELRWQRERSEDADSRCAASIALAFHENGRRTGQLTAYATEPDAFAAHTGVLLALAGAPAQAVVLNDDLPMRGLDDARQGPARLADLESVERAVGFLMARHGIDADAARRELTAGAESAGVEVAAHAESLVDERRPLAPDGD